MQDGGRLCRLHTGLGVRTQREVVQPVSGARQPRRPAAAGIGRGGGGGGAGDPRCSAGAGARPGCGSHKRARGRGRRARGRGARGRGRRGGGWDGIPCGRPVWCVWWQKFSSLWKEWGVCAACLPSGGQDFVCVEGNEWYSQCIPSDGGSSDDAATPSEEVEEKPEQEDVEKPVQEDEEDIVAPVAMAAEPFVVPEDSEGLAGTTRFFDGCKATCSWEGNVGKTVSGPVQSCSNKFDENGNQIR